MYTSNKRDLRVKISITIQSSLKNLLHLTLPLKFEKMITLEFCGLFASASTYVVVTFPRIEKIMVKYKTAINLKLTTFPCINYQK